MVLGFTCTFPLRSEKNKLVKELSNNLIPINFESDRLGIFRFKFNIFHQLYNFL